MTTFYWVLGAVGLFLAVYAAVMLFRAGRAVDSEKPATLGCGFVLLASVVWSIALARLLESWWAGLRLGTALALILPVVGTLFGGRRRHVLSAVVLLTVAVLLAAPVVPALLARFERPDAAQALNQRVQAAVTQFRGQIAATRTYLQSLRTDRAALKERIAALDIEGFEAVMADPRGRPLMTELGEVDRMVAAQTERLAEMEATLIRLETAARRVQRRAEAAEAGVEIDRDAIERILDEARRPPLALGPETVEEQLQRERLRTLYEQEF